MRSGHKAKPHRELNGHSLVNGDFSVRGVVAAGHGLLATSIAIHRDRDVPLPLAVLRRRPNLHRVPPAALVDEVLTHALRAIGVVPLPPVAIIAIAAIVAIVATCPPI